MYVCTLVVLIIVQIFIFVVSLTQEVYDPPHTNDPPYLKICFVFQGQKMPLLKANRGKSSNI